MNKIILLVSITVCIISQGCKKLIEVDTPPNQLTTDKVFADTSSATAAMVGTYSRFNVSIDPNFTKFMSLYVDEIMYTGPSQPSIEFYQSVVPAGNATNLNIWSNTYACIYQCNDIINQLKHSKNLAAAFSDKLISEAKFLRAYCYFLLVNLYGNIPLVLETDVDLNAHAAQVDATLVYKQMITDLKEAQAGLAETYIGSGKVRANKWAATALLARTYLYQRDWANAESEATSVINSGAYTPLQAPANVFLANSKETILSFWTQSGFITDAPNLIPASGVPQYPVTNALVNSFETGDLRKSNWLKSTLVNGTTYYYPYKYRNRAANTTTPEYLVALRAAEQYLVRAEARAQQNNIKGAVADINIIRQRAGLLPAADTISQTECMNIIMHERQIELLVENGNRFFDLKRTEKLNPYMASYKSTWKPTASLLPIPQNEITYNAKLVQNAGY